jgi:hypothetical protein
MKKLIIAAAVAACTVAPVLAQDKPAESPPVSSVEGSDPEALKLIVDCDARKFETVVEHEEGGQKQGSKVKLCGKKGQTDQEWAATLSDAAKKIEARDDMPQWAKDQLTGALKAEIAKIGAGGAANAPAAAVASSPPPPPKIAEKPKASAPALPGATKKPRLTIKCLAPGEKGGGSNCSVIQRNTRLAILADGDLGPGSSLRFLRRGDERGQVALAPMRQGEATQSRLPPELCAGVASSKVEIQVMGSNQVVDTIGPFTLRC